MKSTGVAGGEIYSDISLNNVTLRSAAKSIMAVLSVNNNF
jgi:hypothetical protein